LTFCLDTLLDADTLKGILVF